MSFCLFFFEMSSCFTAGPYGVETPTVWSAPTMVIAPYPNSLCDSSWSKRSKRCGARCAPARDKRQLQHLHELRGGLSERREDRQVVLEDRRHREGRQRAAGCSGR